MREVIAAFMRQAAAALENARLFEEADRRVAELEVLATVSSALRAASTREAVQEALLDSLEALFGGPGAAVAQYDRATDELIYSSLRGGFTQFLGHRVPLSDSIAADVMQSGVPLHVEDVRQHPRLAAYVPGESYAVGCVPLRVGQEPLGVLWVTRHRPFSPAEQRFLVSIADIAANAIHRAQILETLEQRVAERTQELEAANERLTELDQLKSKFVSDISHELRTPLQNIKMYVDLLDRGRSERRVRYLGILKEQIDRLQQLTQNILDLSRLELGVDKVKFSLVDLNALVAQTAAPMVHAAESMGSSLSIELAPSLPKILGEPNQLAQVITNLVANAINYTMEGQIQIMTYKRDQKICLEVTDTGIGIAPADLPHLFERFYRSSQVSQSNIVGTGLGLAIVKEIVDVHGGTIEVESEQGVGSTFRVWFPVQVDGPPVAHSASTTTLSSIESV